MESSHKKPTLRKRILYKWIIYHKIKISAFLTGGSYEIPDKPKMSPPNVPFITVIQPECKYAFFE